MMYLTFKLSMTRVSFLFSFSHVYLELYIFPLADNNVYLKITDVKSKHMYLLEI